MQNTVRKVSIPPESAVVAEFYDTICEDSVYSSVIGPLEPLFA